jgi:1-acyl-sn-glycerol-3-phosphate acyltransferase
MWTIVVVAGVVLAVLMRWRLSGLRWNDFMILRITRAYAQLWHRWSCNRPAPFPPQGPFLVIANHTCSADPPFLLAGCRRTLSFLVAREHYRVHPVVLWALEYLQCVAVTRNGRDPVALRQALRRLDQGLGVCLFPEGNLSGVAKNRFLSAKQGIAFLALHKRVPVYPAYIAGGPRTEALLSSWVRPSRKAVRVTFGPPIDLSSYYNRAITRRLIAEVTEVVMQRIRSLDPDGAGP